MEYPRFKLKSPKSRHHPIFFRVSMPALKNGLCSIAIFNCSLSLIICSSFFFGLLTCLTWWSTVIVQAVPSGGRARETRCSPKNSLVRRSLLLWKISISSIVIQNGHQQVQKIWRCKPMLQVERHRRPTHPGRRCSLPHSGMISSSVHNSGQPLFSTFLVWQRPW